MEDIEGNVACVWMERVVLIFAEGGLDRGCGCKPDANTDARGEDEGLGMRDRLDRGVDGGEGVAR